MSNDVKERVAQALLMKQAELKEAELHVQRLVAQQVKMKQDLSAVCATKMQLDLRVKELAGYLGVDLTQTIHPLPILDDDDGEEGVGKDLLRIIDSLPGHGGEKKALTIQLTQERIESLVNPPIAGRSIPDRVRAGVARLVASKDNGTKLTFTASDMHKIVGVRFHERAGVNAALSTMSNRKILKQAGMTRGGGAGLPAMNIYVV